MRLWLEYGVLEDLNRSIGVAVGEMLANLSDFDTSAVLLC